MGVAKLQFGSYFLKMFSVMIYLSSPLFATVTEHHGFCDIFYLPQFT